MSDDLILHARLELLLANLTRATGVPEMVESQRHDLAQLLTILGPERSTERSILGLTPDLKRNLRKISVDLEVLEDNPAAKEPIERLQTALARVDQLQAKLDQAGEIVERLHRRRVVAAENLSRGPVVMELRSEADDFIRKVKQLLVPSGENGESGADVWRAYSDLLEQIGPRFDECVDLLQGLSAREHGLEAGSAALFELADTMISTWRLTDFQSESFTIPSRQEVVARGRINVLRMGFSEWTVWTLPLVAFEFGGLAVYRSRGIQDWIRDNHANDVDGWQDLMADVLATAALGPAYACAAIILRLLPPRQDDAADHDRVRMILLTLKAVNRQNAYDHIIDRLWTTWTAACGGLDLEKLPGSRDESELAAGVDFLISQSGINLLLVYPFDEFDRARDMANRVMKQQFGQETAAVSAADISDVRNLMNIAWLCRLEHPKAHAAVAECVIGLWADIQTSRRQATGGGRGIRATATSQAGGLR